MMEIRAYLEQARDLDARIERRVEERERIMTQLTSARGSRLTGMPRGGKHDWTDALAAVVDLTRDLDEEIRRLCAIKREIAEVIDGVEDRRYRRLLELRYRSYHTWEQIAAEMNYDPRWVYQLHREALEAAQESREKIGAAKTRGDAGA